MKKVKLILLSLIAVMLLVPNIVFGTSNYDFGDSGSSNYSKYDYYIQSYDVNMVVNEDNTFEIVETIDAFFNVPKHGIIRSIPLTGTVKRANGTEQSMRVKVTDVDVNEKFSLSKSKGNQSIKIGNASKTITGKQQYKISYTYKIFGKDNLDNADEFYFNIIGTEWDIPIQNVSFTIKMPKEFDKEKLGFSAGKYGREGTTDITYKVSGNTITGAYNIGLNAKEGITVRLELPEGYFMISSEFELKSIISIAICILCVLIGVFVWYKYGRDDKPIETVEFYPPEGLNSLDVAFIYKGKVDRQDTISLLIYLANKGYLKIEETGEDGILRKKKFKIIKVKEYDGNNPEERIFFNGLFSGKKEVTKSDLEYSFYKTIDSVVSSKNKKEDKDKIYDKTATKKRMILIPFIIIMMFLTLGLNFSFFKLDPEFLLFAGIGILSTLGILFGTTTRKSTGLSIIITIAISFIALCTRMEDLSCSYTYVIEFVFEIVALATILMLYGISTKYTPYATEMLGKIQGFKTFLETSEKEKLEMLVNEDPQYFYNILPYTYVLGVSDKWMKKFESITIEPPNWYYGYSHYDYMVFDHFMSSTYNSMSSAMTSTPSSSSSGGGYSGGGFSGGGFGGGGGSSW